MVRRGNTITMLTLSYTRMHIATAAQAATAKPCRRDLVWNESRFGTEFPLAARRMR
jgi:hypothetical protein